jgi:hypothetical protein
MDAKKKKVNRTTAARIDVRVSPRLKEALEEYCSEEYETMSSVIKAAIKQYIGYK